MFSVLVFSFLHSYSPVLWSAQTRVVLWTAPARDTLDILIVSLTNALITCSLTFGGWPLIGRAAVVPYFPCPSSMMLLWKIIKFWDILVSWNLVPCLYNGVLRFESCSLWCCLGLFTNKLCLQETAVFILRSFDNCTKMDGLTDYVTSDDKLVLATKITVRHTFNFYSVNSTKKKKQYRFFSSHIFKWKPLFFALILLNLALFPSVLSVPDYNISKIWRKKKFKGLIFVQAFFFPWKRINVMYYLFRKDTHSLYEQTGNVLQLQDKKNPAKL